MNFTDPKFIKAIEIVRKEMTSENKLKADQVIKKYGALFHPSNIPSLSEEDFRGFLNYKNNRHWTGIHRHSSALVSDMNRLREALVILLDENKPLENRLRILRPHKGEPFIKGLARSVITPILFVVYPEKYGVLNNPAEQGMKEVNIYPALSKNADFAEEYIAVNEVILKISNDFSLPLWFVDWIWWKIESIGDEENGEVFDSDNYLPEAKFGLERYLHEFLLDNWENLELSKAWNLYEKDDEIIGSEFKTDIGRIDLLAHHKIKNEWLVIELKRDQAVDKTVGQALRYMGWVQKNLAGPNDTVRGLIIAKEKDEKLVYALSQVPKISFKAYQVHFELLDEG